MSSIQSTMSMTQEQRIAALEQSVAELRQRMAEGKGKKGKKEKAEAASASEGPKEKKEPSEWNQEVAQLVAEMKESGWQSWTDLKGVVWAGSRRGMVKDKKSGVETEQYVYDGGEHDGKQPSPALGGMVRASCLRAQSSPEAKAKAIAHHTKLAEKRSNASTGSGTKEEPVADAPAAGKKGRKMTDEQKAAAKAKRDAKKAAEAEAAAVAPVAEAEAEAEEFEDVSTTPVVTAAVPAPVPAPAPAPAAANPKPKPRAKPAPKVDLNFRIWEHEGNIYAKNARGDVVSDDGSEWVGVFDGSKLNTAAPEPNDLGAATILREDE